jgi:hypothetical protein
MAQAARARPLLSASLLLLCLVTEFGGLETCHFEPLHVHLGACIERINWEEHQRPAGIMLGLLITS